jgi:hypothetical protein
VKLWLWRIVYFPKHRPGKGKLLVHQVERRLVALVPIEWTRGKYAGAHLGLPA